MDARQAVDEIRQEEVGLAGDDCPRCAEPYAGPEPVSTSLLGRAGLRRCRRCGARFGSGEESRLLLVRCGRCSLPFLAEPSGPDGGDEPRCRACGEAGRLADLPEPALSAATEREVLLALESRWEFVTSESSAVYLNKVLRQIAARIDGAPERGQVVIFDDRSLRTLALPSGLILVSQGMLDELEDEAQLAFVLGHELAHSAGGDAARRLVRLGLHAVAHDGGGAVEAAWADAALDVVRLGYGQAHEHEADARALDALLAAGYDPHSVKRLLRRWEMAVERGEERVAELALAHPTCGDRLRRLEDELFRRIDAEPGRRVNREVFRRAAGRHADTVVRAPLDTVAPGAGETGGTSRRGGWQAALPWLAAGIALIITLLLLLGLVV